MKNKKLTYLLGVIVVAVWGMIIYRIFKAANGDNEETSSVAVAEKKEAYNDYNIPKDTTHLLLNYRDPFAVQKTDTGTIPVHKSHSNFINNKPPLQKAVINWSVIKYAGYIHNARSKKMIALMSVNGKELMMYEGETSDGLKLIKSTRDSVKVSYQGAIRFITVNNKNP